MNVHPYLVTSVSLSSPPRHSNRFGTMMAPVWSPTPPHPCNDVIPPADISVTIDHRRRPLSLLSPHPRSPLAIPRLCPPPAVHLPRPPPPSLSPSTPRALSPAPSRRPPPPGPRWRPFRERDRVDLSSVVLAGQLRSLWEVSCAQCLPPLDAASAIPAGQIGRPT